MFRPLSDLTSERLAELRRIAEAATPGPWAWRMSKDGRILDLITLETGYNEEIITPSHINAWLQVKGGLKDFIPAFDPTTVLALLDRIDALEAENERLRQIEAAARTLVDTAFEVPGPDEYVYQAVRVDHFNMLVALLKGEGGATHA